jgi:hypothetical protein
MSVGMRFTNGTWLQRYDPDAYEGHGEVVATMDPADAMRFADTAAAMEEWKRPSTVRPTRADGEPNRPLSALTVSIEELP